MNRENKPERRVTETKYCKYCHLVIGSGERLVVMKSPHDGNYWYFHQELPNCYRLWFDEQNKRNEVMLQ